MAGAKRHRIKIRPKLSMKPNRTNKKINQTAPRQHTESKVVYWGVFVSIVFHAVILVALLIMPELTPARKIPYSVVDVRLVSLPEQKPAPKAPEKKDGASATPKAAPAPKPKTNQKAVAAKPAPTEKRTVPEPKSVSNTPKAPKRSLKQKTFKSSKVLESTLSKLKKQVDQSQPPSLEKALERLKEQVETTEPAPRTETPPAQAAAGSPAASTPSEQEIRNRIQIYNAEIAYQIRKNWVFSEQLAGDGKDLETALGITILPDGRIDKIWFDAKSGNRYLDDSAYRALMKSSPLPPLPEGIFDSSYTVGLRFGPKGLKQ